MIIIYLLILLLISVYLNVGTGRIGLFYGSTFYLNVAYLFFTMVLFLYLGWGYWIFLACVVILAIYAPVGILYGKINSDFFLAFWATFGEEASEFTKSIPVNYFIFSIFSVVFYIFCYFEMPRFPFSKETLIAMLSIFVVITTVGKFWNAATTTTIAQFFIQFRKSYKRLKQINTTPIIPQWQIISTAPKYKNYVVVIGESMRKDYMHLYGYNTENTPFLDKVNGTFVDGYHATAVSTIPNLHNTLNYNQNINLNIIDLANLAGFDTFWLSNQGYLGEWDTPITKIAKHSKNTYFLSNDVYEKKKSDANLVRKFVEFLHKKSTKPRIFFIHLYGSHPDPCERLISDDYKKYRDKKTFTINCYVKTIAQTDGDLESIYSALSANFKDDANENFSMIYFSDHGLTHTTQNGKISFLYKDPPSKQALEIPLIKLSSDDKNRTFIKNVSFNNYFSQYFANWIGVQTSNITEFSDIFAPVIQPDSLNSGAIIDKNLNDGAIKLE